MLDQNIIKQVYAILEPLIQSLAKSEDEIIDESDSLSTIRNAFIRLSFTLSDIKPLPLKKLEALKAEVKKANAELKNFPNNAARQNYFDKEKKLKDQELILSTDLALTLSDSIPDILNLLIMTNISSQLAHSEILKNEQKIHLYQVKDIFLQYLIDLAPQYENLETLILPSSRQNAKSVVYFVLRGGTSVPSIFAWHSKVDPPEKLELNINEYIPRQFHLNKRLNLEDISEDSIHSFFSLYSNSNTEKLNALFLLQNSPAWEEIFSLNKNNSKKSPNEFIGGGNYENSILDEGPQNLSKAENATPWDLITRSSNPEIQNLLKSMQTDERCYDFSVSEIIKMEILHKAFLENIITQRELDSLQLECISSFVTSKHSKDRLEIKECGKDSDIGKGILKKFLVIRVQNNPQSKPILWEVSKDVTNSLPELTQTSGRTVKEINNVPLIETILSKDKKGPKNTNIQLDNNPKESNPPEIDTPLPFSAKDLDDFLNQPDSKERLHNAMANASPEVKAFLAAIISQLDPTLLPIKKNKSTCRRKGGPSLE